MLVARTGGLGIGTERTVEAIRATGLTLVQGEVTRVVHPEAAPRLDRPVSLLVVAVKAYALDAALDRIEPGSLDGAVVLPLLNGLEHVDLLRERFALRRGAAEAAPRAAAEALGGGVASARPRAAADALGGGVASAAPLGPFVAAGSIGGVEAFAPEPGFVIQRTAGATITAASGEVDRTTLAATLEPLRVPGIDVVVADDERSVLWEKAARLAVLAAASVASGKPVGELRSDPAWLPRVRAALGEACAVAQQDGVELDPATQWSIVEGLPEGLLPSAARDAAVGRPTELDAITGSVVRVARRLGVWTPMLDGLLADAARHS